MTDEERRAYLAESLFINQVKYENDRLSRYLKTLERTALGDPLPPTEGD